MSDAFSSICTVMFENANVKVFIDSVILNIVSYFRVFFNDLHMNNFFFANDLIYPNDYVQY
jgi:hypothetical protein